MDKEGISHYTSSPKYPESNEAAERAVQTVKRLWEKTGDKVKSLMIYRDTPLESGYSPAQLLMGRSIRTGLPRAVQKKVVREEFEGKDRQIKDRMKSNFDTRRKARKVDELEPGEAVWVKAANNGKGQKGIVEGKAKEPNSYVVNVEGGKLRRNRKHLSKLFGNGNREGEGVETERGISRGEDIWSNLNREGIEIEVGSDYEEESEVEDIESSEEEESSGEETESEEDDREPSVPVRAPERAEEGQRMSRYGRVYKPNSRYRDYVT